MAAGILSCVLPLAEEVTLGGVQDRRAVLPRALVVGVDVLDPHHGAVKLRGGAAAWTLDHDHRPVAERELDAVAGDSQPLPEPEGEAEPGGGRAHVLVGELGDERARRHRSVARHDATA